MQLGIAVKAEMALLCGRSFGILTQRFNAATLGSNFTPCRELFRPHCTLAFGREQARPLAFFRFLTGCVEIIGAFVRSRPQSGPGGERNTIVVSLSRQTRCCSASLHCRDAI